MASISIKVFRGKEGFYQIKNAWDRIVDTLKDKHLIHLYHWHKSYIDTIENNDFDAIFLLMYKDGNPFAIFPIQEHVKNIFGFKFIILQIPHCNDLDMVDFIFEKNIDNANLIQVFINSIRQYTGIKWNCIYFPQVLENSSIYFSLKKSSCQRVILDKVGESQYLQCESYEQIRQKISKHFRSELNLKGNRLSRLGDVEYISARKKDDLNKEFNDFLELEASGWKGQHGTAIKSNVKDKKFYENLTDNFSDIDSCELSLLTLNNEIIAGSYWLVNDSTVYFLKIGYDKKYSKVSPGVLLLDHDIGKYADDHSINTISLFSDYQWQARWKPSSMDVFNIIIFNKSSFNVFCYSLLKVIVRVYRRCVKPVLWKYEKYVRQAKKNERVFLKNA